MHYLNNDTNERLHVNELRELLRHQCCFPDGGEVPGWTLLQITTKPAPESDCKVVEGAPVNGVQTWLQVPLTTAEIEMEIASIREDRRIAYMVESDPLILKALTEGGDLGVAQAEAMAVKAAIRVRLPYPMEATV